MTVYTAGLRRSNYCLKKATVKSGSTPVGGPVKSRHRRMKEKGRGLDKKLVRPELVTAWIQRQGQLALIPCIDSGQEVGDGNRDGDRQELE